MPTESFSSSEILALVAHDLKSPISAVRGYIELVEQAGPLNELQARYCNRAVAGLERMEQIIFSMLEMARLEDDELTLELGNCDMAALARSALELVESSAEQRGLRLESAIDDMDAIVFGDKRLLSQVIANLLTNAIKYNRDNGRVWLKLTVQPDHVRVDVQDTGVGIPEEDQPHIFERFYRARNPASKHTSGSGLGLTIVKTIIEQHQGYIWFESEEGEGSRFSFTLPRRKVLSEGADSIPEPGTQSGEGRDMHQAPPHELSIEDHDDVDDNTQEADPYSDADSSSDEL